MRIQLFEFEDFSWFPAPLREGGTDYLKHFLAAAGFYKPVIPLLLELIEKTNQQNIVDLCSGGGGPVEQISRELNKKSNSKILFSLSDKFPNVDAYQYICAKSDGVINFKKEPVDATSVPFEMKGLRTMFSAVHHFDPGTVKSILKNAVNQKAAIALFDGGDKNIFTILGILLFHPLAFLICTPFFKPFKFSRIIFTYLLPLIPLTTVWDGCVSILRLYTPEELFGFTTELSPNNYCWKAGKVKNKLGMKVTYLVGYPANP